MPSHFHRVLPLFGLLAVAGCTLFGEDETRPCPAVVKHQEISEAVQYAEGKGRDLIDLRFSGKIGDVAWKCTYDGNVSLEMVLEIQVLLEKGPAAKGQIAKFPFFVAITDKRQNILAKEVFTSEVEFPKGRRRAGVIEEVEQIIPLKTDQTGADYEIIVGFQLTREQLEFNRRRRR